MIGRVLSFIALHDKVLVILWANAGILPDIRLIYLVAMVLAW